MQKRVLQTTLAVAHNVAPPVRTKTEEKAVIVVITVITVNVRCIQQFAQDAVRKPRFPSSRAGTDRFTAKNAISQQ
jgi:hypothetical protein